LEKVESEPVHVAHEFAGIEFAEKFHARPREPREESKIADFSRGSRGRAVARSNLKKGGPAMKEPKCRICGCTQDRACPAGCGWDYKDPEGADICTVCSAFKLELGNYLEACDGVTAASLRRLLEQSHVW
jgi:hypothetical protein